MMNILVTSVFVFVIVFDMVYPDKGLKIHETKGDVSKLPF